MAHKTVCVFSGGMDSTTLLYQLLAEGDEVLALSYDYGQRHKKELDYAARTCAKLGVNHQVIDLTSINALLGGSALTSLEIAVPEGHYQDQSMRATVVPNRNMIMLAIAGGYAVAQQCQRLAIAVHAGDHAIYPDCRPEFIEPFQQALRTGNYHQVEVYAPFLHWSKSRIARLGERLGVDFASDTWSCYKGEAEPCGKCGTCVERSEALDSLRSELY